MLPLETLKTFHELGVEPPATNEDVPKTIAALEAKKKEFEEKRDKAAAEPPSEDEPEPEEAAAEEAGADGDKVRRCQGRVAHTWAALACAQVAW